MTVSVSSIRHTPTTLFTSFNAGVSLQALMALLGHVSAAMSLRYARLFDATVRTEYERRPRWGWAAGSARISSPGCAPPRPS